MFTLRVLPDCVVLARISHPRQALEHYQNNRLLGVFWDKPTRTSRLILDPGGRIWEHGAEAAFLTSF